METNCREKRKIAGVRLLINFRVSLITEINITSAMANLITRRQAHLADLQVEPLQIQQKVRQKPAAGLLLLLSITISRRTACEAHI
jgi:hypothetical protein